MIEWKYKFERNTLERGLAFYLNKRVADLEKNNGTYTAAVLGIRYFEVQVRMQDGYPASMKCNCPISGEGENCEHMAAVLYAIEAKEKDEIYQKSEQLTTLGTIEEIEEQQLGEITSKAESYHSDEENAMVAHRNFKTEFEEDKEDATKYTAEDKTEDTTKYTAEDKIEDTTNDTTKDKSEDVKEYTLLGGSPSPDPEESASLVPSSTSSESIASLEHYNYFNGTAIRKSMDIPKSSYVEGENLLRQGKIKIVQIKSGYDQDNGRILGQLDAIGKSGTDEFSIQLQFSRTKVINFGCRCPKCRTGYYMWFSRKTTCGYKAGVLIKLEEYLAVHNIGDATDLNAKKLMSFYQEKRANLTAAGTIGKENSLKLIPRVIKKGGNLAVSFRVGEKKLFIVKHLDTFCQNVKESAIDVYGTNTQINHSPKNFTEKGRGWIHFISRIVREEEEFYQRLMESSGHYMYRKQGVGSELNLFGWRLDEFYEQLGEDTIEYDDKDVRQTKKGTLTCLNRNPKVVMRISDEEPGSDEFHGIKVEGSLPDMYRGSDSDYYIDGNNLCRIDRDFMQKIEPLTNLSFGNYFSFHVGRNHMSEFYHRILPSLQGVVDIRETDSERFKKYLLPDAHFIFYLDAQDKNVTCRLHARYGEKEVSVLDILNNNRISMEPYRDTPREEEVLYQTMQWFPEVDEHMGELHCGKNEDLVYQIMESGTEKLMEIGEVRCTKRFLGYHAVRTIKVSVGVSVSSGLLELNITTDDIPQNEMLDILNSYRTKKKYYRLKDGSFVNLSDSSLEMLAELMESMQLKPKEFVKGKMHLPMYRTLYLDKMLEENDSIYSTRDSHFREVVKNFKTVKEADFEEPESLSKIMRNYQKNGYKWLRTLEAWQFGGILADDMGLGKTLQVIAVLLAAKQEGHRETSIVVSPASLVFNWGEEFQKFAPELKVSLITGTQDERQLKIEAYKESDVIVTSYDLLKRDIVYYEDKQFAYEIIDEAQYIKNHTTEAAKAVKIIKSRIRYALTGTPIENRLSELWSIFDYLMPGFLYSYDVFKRELESPIVKNNDEQAMKRLQKMVNPFILRRLKEDVLKDLPQKLEESRIVKMGSTQQTLYDAQVLHMRERLAGQNDEEFNKNKLLILAELTKLRQICCDPSLCFDNYEGGAAKLEACMELIQSAIDGGHRMLVFSQFTSMLEILQKSLDSSGIAYYTIMGSTSKEKRLELVKEFNEGNTPIFLISLRAGGVGLNLTGADMVIHYDPWWNLAVQNQATDRAHRIGQTKKVIVYKLIMKNTIEEKILKLQETKKNLAEQVIGSDSGQIGSLSRDEILELLEI